MPNPGSSHSMLHLLRFKKENSQKWTLKDDLEVGSHHAMYSQFSLNSCCFLDQKQDCMILVHELSQTKNCDHNRGIPQESLFSTTLIKFFAGGIRRMVCKNNSCLLERKFCKQLQEPSGCIGRYFDTNVMITQQLSCTYLHCFLLQALVQCFVLKSQDHE